MFSHLHFARAFLDWDSLVFFASFFCMTFSRYLSFTVFFWRWLYHLSPSLSRELGEIGLDRYLGAVSVLSMGLHWEMGGWEREYMTLRWIGGFWSITPSRHHASRRTMVPARVWILESHELLGGVWLFGLFQVLEAPPSVARPGIFPFCFFPSFSLSLTGHGWVGRHGTVRSWFGRTHMD